MSAFQYFIMIECPPPSLLQLSQENELQGLPDRLQVWRKKEREWRWLKLNVLAARMATTFYQMHDVDSLALELVDKKKRLPTSRTNARGNLGFHCTSVCPFTGDFIDKQHKTVG